jgi:hypothetical protein
MGRTLGRRGTVPLPFSSAAIAKAAVATLTLSP